MPAVPGGNAHYTILTCRPHGPNGRVQWIWRCESRGPTRSDASWLARWRAVNEAQDQIARSQRHSIGRQMTRDQERAYVKGWVETGALLEEIRWRELRQLDDKVALDASATLVEAALRVPLPAQRRQWSGLAEQQNLLHRRKRP